MTSNLDPVPLHADITAVDDAVVCAPVGDLHMDNEPHLRTALDRALAQAPGLLVVDLSKTNLLTSSALNALLAARHDAARRGVPVVLAAPPHPVRQVLRVTEADQVFPVYPTLLQAVRHRAPDAPAV